MMAVNPIGASLHDLEPIRTHHLLTRKDTILYALGVGASDLRYLYERRLEALPTMAAILGYPGFFWIEPRYGVDWTKALSVGTSITIHAPLPVEGEMIGVTHIGPVYDKGRDKGALVEQTRQISYSDGTPIATVRGITYLRGDGGCGSTRPDERPPPACQIPQRKPDEVARISTPGNLALIYRLSGDRNPLHVDPEVALSAGFDRAILHGLATFGVAGRALVTRLAGNDPARMRNLQVRYRAPFYPGETLETSMWRESPTSAFFRARSLERDLVVLDNGYAEWS